MVKINQTYSEVVRHLQAVLNTAQSKRKERPGMTEVPSFYNDSVLKIFEWNLYELNEMRAAVTLIRINNFLFPVSLKDIQKAEQFAVGHSDYSKKFAFACADLVFKE